MPLFICYRTILPFLGFQYALAGNSAANPYGEPLLQVFSREVARTSEKTCLLVRPKYLFVAFSLKTSRVGWWRGAASQEVMKPTPPTA